MGQTKNNGAAQTPAAGRNYKSTVFAMLFGDRERLLRLYNAISGKNYQDPEELEINTLDNAIYMGMKIDTLLLDFSQTCQGKHLKASGICHNRLVPGHKFVEAAQLPDNPVPGSYMKMIGV